MRDGHSHAELFTDKGIQCQYVTLMGINWLQKNQSTKMIVTVQILFGFDTVGSSQSLRRPSFSKLCITA